MKENPWSYFPILLLAVVFIILGIIMIANDLYGVGFREEYNSYSAISGHYLVLAGVLFLIITYFCLSPFNKIRMFVEGGFRKRVKSKNKRGA